MSTYSIFAGLMALALTISIPAYSAPSAVEIMERSQTALRPKGITADVSLTVIEPSNERRVLKLGVWSKLQDNAQHSSIKTKFLAPADLRDTVFLQIEGQGASDASWVFLPALRKVRRLPSTEKRNAFFGTDFNYGDVLPPAVEPFKHGLLGEETIDGARCWMVESTSLNRKTSDELGYHRRVSWIDASSYVDRKIEYFDEKGLKLRVQTASAPIAVGTNGTWVMQRREMVQQTTGRKTLLEYQRVQYTPDLSEQLFYARSLQDAQ